MNLSFPLMYDAINSLQTPAIYIPRELTFSKEKSVTTYMERHSSHATVVDESPWLCHQCH
jgi:hypothetical protein